MGTETSGNALNAAWAAVLRRIKEERGVTFHELAATTGISVRQLKRIINDERAMTTDDLVRCAAALGVTVTQVVNDAIENTQQRGQ